MKKELSNKLENLKKLTELAKSDPELGDKITELIKAKDFKAVVQIAAEHGIAFEEADFTPPGERKLDLDELEGVAGGMFTDEDIDDIEETCDTFGVAVFTASCAIFLGSAFYADLDDMYNVFK